MRKYNKHFKKQSLDYLARLGFSKITGLITAIVLILGLPVLILSTRMNTNNRQYAETPAPPPIWYSVSGKQILKNGTTPFIPYGVQIGGISMAVTNWSTNNSKYITYDQVLAAKNIWHSNTVSLQLASAALFAKQPYDTDYLNRVDRIVNWVTGSNMNIILVLQYEATNKQRMPTQDSVNFWNLISKHYANRARIMFDVFNEPDTTKILGGWDDDNAWNFYMNGGTANGTIYIGVQQLVNTIRNNAQNNLIIVNGLAAGEDIKLLPKHTVTGKNIVYAVHPYFNATQHANAAQWDNWFGNAAAAGNFPVVVNEWSEYQNANDGECFPGADKVVPTFLSYLKQKNIGLIGYALFPGTLIRGWDFTNPTKFDKQPYTCPQTTTPDLRPDAQGAGELLMDYFLSNSANSGSSTTP